MASEWTRPQSWWPLALSEQVTNKKPLPVRCGDEQVVLFRDGTGTVRALEDRCPHRRVPLSLGKITAQGRLQCGYHGWTFDGASGKCVAIPNLHDDEKVPARYGAQPYTVIERDGFVHVWIGSTTPAMDRIPTLAIDGTAREHVGAEMLPMAHDQFVAALFDGPQVVLDMPTVRLTDFLLGDPMLVDGRLVLDRGATWAGPHLPDRFVVEWGLVFRVSVDPGSGETLAEVRDRDENLVLSAAIAAAPNARGSTSVLWRCRAATETRGKGGILTRSLARTGMPPLRVRRFISGRALSALRVGPSHMWRSTVRAETGSVPRSSTAA